jgi:hypothetical protein
VLFLLAGAILLACAISSPLKLIFLFTSDMLVFLAVASCVAAVAARGLTTAFVRRVANRCFLRLIAPVALFVALAVVSTAIQLGDYLVGRVLGVEPVLSSATAFYALIAMELLWIGLLG